MEEFKLTDNQEYYDKVKEYDKIFSGCFIKQLKKDYQIHLEVNEGASKSLIEAIINTIDWYKLIRNMVRYVYYEYDTTLCEWVEDEDEQDSDSDSDSECEESDKSEESEDPTSD
jgi:hypothetical protein